MSMHRLESDLLVRDHIEELLRDASRRQRLPRDTTRLRAVRRRVGLGLIALGERLAGRVALAPVESALGGTLNHA